MNPFDLILKIYDRSNGVIKVVVFVIGLTIVATLSYARIRTSEKRLDKIEPKVESIEKQVITELSAMNGYLKGLAENRRR